MGVVVGVTEVLMLLSLILVTLRGDTNALCSFDLENVTLVAPECVTLTVCWQAQPALTCAPWGSAFAPLEVAESRSATWCSSRCFSPLPTRSPEQPWPVMGPRMSIPGVPQ